MTIPFEDLGLAAQIGSLKTRVTDLEAAVTGLPWKVTSVPLRQDNSTTVTSTVFAERYGFAVALAANTNLQTLVTVTGSGILMFAGLYHDAYGTAYSATLQVEVDGTLIANGTLTSTTLDSAYIAVGAVTDTSINNSPIIYWQVPFRTGFIIRASKSNVTPAVNVLYTHVLAAPYVGA